MRIYNVTDSRFITAEVERERNAGLVILSKTAAGGGYYLPKDKSEVEAFIRQMESRIRKIRKSTRSAKAYIKNTEIDGQMSLFEE